MRRAVVGFVASVIAAGSVLGATPAQAGPGDPVACLPPVGQPPAQGVVTVNGFDVTVNPGGAPGVNEGTVWSAVLTALAYYDCTIADVDDPAWCLLINVWPLTGNPTHYVTQNPDGSITFHGNELFADTGGCVL